MSDDQELLERGLNVVANAEPYQHTYNSDGSISYEHVTGGLTTGLDPVMQEHGSYWIGWGRGSADFSPSVVDENDQVAVPPEHEQQYLLQRLDLSEAERNGFYLGYSNQVLWPGFHGFTDTIVDSDWWDTYEAVNQRYADAANAVVGDEAVLVQDYQLALTPEMIRDEQDDTTIGYFLHIPFPDADDYMQIPHHEELLDGVSASDLIGVHTDRDVENLLGTVEALGADVDHDEQAYAFNGHETRVAAVPLGIDYDRFTEPDTADFEEQFRDNLDVDHLLFGLDRTDYTKGLPEKLDAYEQYLEDNPDMHGDVMLYQNVSPSRTDIPVYRDLVTEINEKAAAINWTYGHESWEPVRLVDTHASHDEIVGMYRAADVLLVTPLIDGMNLVAKEGVAANYTGENDGILVLGEQAGAAEVMTDAIQVDPTDTDALAGAIDAAIEMSDAERRKRMRTLNDEVRKHDVDWWMEQYLEELESAT